MRIAVLLTTFNRKEKTLTCLESLRAQVLPAGLRVEVYLTDDASRDGTAEAVKKAFPFVHLFEGTGSLYWAGGMRFTWRKALEQKFDFYLLLNDDTTLLPHALATLVSTSTGEGENTPALCIGSTCDTFSGKQSYGGWKLLSSKQWKSEPVPAGGQATDCDFGNANIMLVPAQVVEKIGILADHFTHSLADYDYSLKARKAGFAVRQAPGFLGSCVDDHGNNWKSAGTSLKERIAYLKSPKGLAYKEYLRFISDHFPLSYPTAFVKLWAKTFLPVLWDRFKARA